jgi:hypothetical protein
MNFSQLTNHLTNECGCNIDHLGENIHIAKNCINGEMVIIEDLPFYETAMLAYFFHTLNVDIPENLQEFIHVFDAFNTKHATK